MSDFSVTPQDSGRHHPSLPCAFPVCDHPLAFRRVGDSVARSASIFRPLTTPEVEESFAEDQQLSDDGIKAMAPGEAGTQAGSDEEDQEEGEEKEKEEEEEEEEEEDDSVFGKHTTQEKSASQRKNSLPSDFFYNKSKLYAETQERKQKELEQMHSSELTFSPQVNRTDIRRPKNVYTHLYKMVKKGPPPAPEVKDAAELTFHPSLISKPSKRNAPRTGNQASQSLYEQGLQQYISKRQMAEAPVDPSYSFHPEVDPYSAELAELQSNYPQVEDRLYIDREQAIEREMEREAVKADYEYQECYFAPLINTSDTASRIRYDVEQQAKDMKKKQRAAIKESMKGLGKPILTPTELPRTIHMPTEPAAERLYKQPNVKKHEFAPRKTVPSIVDHKMVLEGTLPVVRPYEKYVKKMEEEEKDQVRQSQIRQTIRKCHEEKPLSNEAEILRETIRRSKLFKQMALRSSVHYKTTKASR